MILCIFLKIIFTFSSLDFAFNLDRNWRIRRNICFFQVVTKAKLHWWDFCNFYFFRVFRNSNPWSSHKKSWFFPEFMSSVTRKWSFFKKWFTPNHHAERTPISSKTPKNHHFGKFWIFLITLKVSRMLPVFLIYDFLENLGSRTLKSAKIHDFSLVLDRTQKGARRFFLTISCDTHFWKKKTKKK